MKKLLLVFCFLLLMSGAAAAQPVTLTDIGTVDLPPDVIVTPETKWDANTTGYFLQIKDGAIWRSISIEKYASFVPGEQDKQKIMQMFWTPLLALPEFKAHTLSVEPAKKLTLNGKDCLNASFKLDCTDEGVVANTEVFMVSEPDGVKILEFICADGDLPYWHPFMLKIAGATSSKGAIS